MGKKITVLITGFEDSPHYDNNNMSARTLESLANRLPADADVQYVTRSFPIDPDRARLAVRQALEEVKPDFVICLGQDPEKTEAPRVEYNSGAVNAFQWQRNEGIPKPIEPQHALCFRREGCMNMDLIAPPGSFSNQCMGRVAQSPDAGTFLCNLVYYEMLRGRQERGERGNVLFLHLAKPKDLVFRHVIKEADPQPFADYYAKQVEDVAARAVDLVQGQQAEQARAALIAHRKEELYSEVNGVLQNPDHPDYPLFRTEGQHNMDTLALQYLMYKMGMLERKEKPGRKTISGSIERHTGEALGRLYEKAGIAPPEHWNTPDALEAAILYEDRLKSSLSHYQQPTGEREPQLSAPLIPTIPPAAHRFESPKR